MKLCVGASSRRIIEEAARLQVAQIVASRRQVDIGGGYTGLDQRDLVNVVHKISNGMTRVIRDHGGPMQGGTQDDGITSLDEDVRVGFDGLHLDVCQLPVSEQPDALKDLVMRYSHFNHLYIEVGGEHDTTQHNMSLLKKACFSGHVDCVVIGTGTHVWADRQIGRPISIDALSRGVAMAQEIAPGIQTKIHNADFMDRRVLDDVTTFYNIAPEFGAVEVDAILQVIDSVQANQLLDEAYDTNLWQRWFNPHEGDFRSRAKCAIRYILADSQYQELTELNDHQEDIVRRKIRHAIQRG